MGKVIRRGESVRQQAIDVLQNGGSIDEAAAITGYGKDYVRQLGAKNGIRFARKHADYEMIVEMYKGGMTPTEISRSTNIGSTTIYKHCIALG